MNELQKIASELCDAWCGIHTINIEEELIPIFQQHGYVSSARVAAGDFYSHTASNTGTWILPTTQINNEFFTQRKYTVTEMILEEGFIYMIKYFIRKYKFLKGLKKGMGLWIYNKKLRKSWLRGYLKSQKNTSQNIRE